MANSNVKFARKLSPSRANSSNITRVIQLTNHTNALKRAAKGGLLMNMTLKSTLRLTKEHYCPRCNCSNPDERLLKKHMNKHLKIPKVLLQKLQERSYLQHAAKKTHGQRMLIVYSVSIILYRNWVTSYEAFLK